jgi:hypothetical protein
MERNGKRCTFRVWELQNKKKVKMEKSRPSAND